MYRLTKLLETGKGKFVSFLGLVLVPVLLVLNELYRG
jgi:hypothetical protein